MPAGLFPQLSAMLQKRRGQPGQPAGGQQQMPMPPGYQPEQSPFQPAQLTPMAGNMPKQQPQQGVLGQQLFNQQQKAMNTGLAGGKFNRRRY